MTGSSSPVSVQAVGLVLSVACVGLVFMGGWYFQQSLADLKTQLTEQQQFIGKQQEQIRRQDFYIKKQQVQNRNQEMTINKQQQYVEEKNKIIESQLRDHNNIILTLLAKQDNMSSQGSPFYDTAKHGIVKRELTEGGSQLNLENLQILRGRDGRDGRDGVPGPSGSKGNTGNTGAPGPKGDKSGGVVYVRWGHNSCPSGGAQLVYAGRAGGSHYTQSGGGGNPQCLPLNPNYFRTVSGAQTWSYMYGAEYEQTNTLVSGSHQTDVPCAVCYVPNRSTLYMLPAKYTCPTGWTREYYGYLMAEYHAHHRSTFSCVDRSLTPVVGSHHNHNGFLFYPVEGVCGSLPCPPYDRNKELSCAVCTK